MKFLSTSLFAFGLLAFVGELHCMPPKKSCTTKVEHMAGIGKVTTTNCKYSNGCTSTKTQVENGGYFKDKNCSGKRK